VYFSLAPNSRETCLRWSGTRQQGAATGGTT